MPSYLREGTNAYYLDDPVNIAVALQDGGTLIDGTVLPKAGIYFYSYELRYTEKLKFSSGKFNALDEKYLPDIPAEKIKNMPSEVFRVYYGETTSYEISKIFYVGTVVFLIDAGGFHYLNGTSMTGFDFVNVDTAGGYINNIHVNNDDTWSRSKIKIGS